jgi:hypothetical protein
VLVLPLPPHPGNSRNRTRQPKANARHPITLIFAKLCSSRLNIYRKPADLNSNANTIAVMATPTPTTMPIFAPLLSPGPRTFWASAYGIGVTFPDWSVTSKNVSSILLI